MDDHLPEMVTCPIHGEFDWRLQYSQDEVEEMFDEDEGDIDCPYCLQEIVGVE